MKKIIFYLTVLVIVCSLTGCLLGGEQVSCNHDWIVTGVRGGCCEPDDYMIIDAQCSICGAVDSKTPAPSSEGVSYSVEGDHVVVSDDGFEGEDLYIPAYYGTYPVTEVGSFTGNSHVKNVYIAEGVTTVADDAFNNCKLLQGIWFPDSAQTFGMSVLSGCHVLKSVRMYDDIEYPGDYMFTGCYNLQEVSPVSLLRNECYFDFADCYIIIDKYGLSDE